MHQRGFTLVELIIVVAMLGILAALFIPKFTSATDEAQVASSEVQINTARKAIKRYQLDHSAYPSLASLWTNLTTTTDADGNVDANANGRFGPYMTEAPVNP